MATRIYKYDNVRALCEVLDKPRLQAWDCVSIENYSEDEAKKFYGLPNIQAACDLLLNGDVKSAKKIKAAGDVFPVAMKSKRPNMCPSAVGCIANVPAYLMNQPKSMYAIKNERRETPVITINVHCGFPWYIKTREITEASAKIANVIAATEAAGVRCELNVVALSRFRNKENEDEAIQLNIKKAGAPLNLINSAFPLCHPAFFRAILLAHMERMAPNVSYGHGTTVRSEETLRSVFGDGVYFSIIDIIEEGSTIEQLTKKVNDEIKKKAYE